MSNHKDFNDHKDSPPQQHSTSTNAPSGKSTAQSEPTPEGKHQSQEPIPGMDNFEHNNVPPGSGLSDKPPHGRLPEPPDEELPEELALILEQLEPQWRHPEASWRVDDPSDPVSLASKTINALHVYLAYLTLPRMEDLIDDHTTRVHARTGLTVWKAEQIAMVGLTLTNFPRFAHLVSGGAFHFQLVFRLCEHLSIVKTNHRKLVDHAVVKLLEPTVPNQAMRSLKWIDDTLARLMEFIDPLAVPVPKDTPDTDAGTNTGTDGDADAGTDADTDNTGINPDDVPPMDEDTYHDGVSSFSYDNRDPNYTTFTLTVDAITGVELLKAINNAATTNNTTQGQAFLGLLRGQTTASITLNLYKNTFGLPLDDVFGEGHWLTTAASAAWLDRITHLAGAGTSDNNGYQPSARTAAMVAGRDGHCRFPGCTIPAHRCQIDHVHRYDHTNPTTSGPTSTDNLHLLCAKHHRLKTAGNWDVTLHPDGTETWTSHGDGHTITTTSDGPLGRETFQHKATRRIRVTHAYNERRLGIIDQEDEPDSKNDEPPF
ncbi:HNH endonuclease signature motif containing protein [Corynebacterium auriscanis]|uniref:HNH endonuclease signature motif containing protein n=1 Tax=Corynebacterium auriscanis TaxID=99807 RepID=UPI003CFBC192